MTVRTSAFNGFKLTINSGVGLDIAAGKCLSDTWMQQLDFGGMLNKQHLSTWSAGGNGGLADSNAGDFNLAFGTFHLYAIELQSTGAVDILGSLSPYYAETCTISLASPGVVTLNDHGLLANAPAKITTNGALPIGLTAGAQLYVKTVLDRNTFTVSSTRAGTAINTSGSQSGTHTLNVGPIMPAGYVEKRYLWPVMTNGSGQLRAAVQLGNEFLFADPVLDVAGVASMGTAAVLRDLTLPKGVKTHAILNVGSASTDAGSGYDHRGYLSSPDENDNAFAGAYFNYGQSNAANGVQLWMPMMRVRTGRGAHIRTRNSASGAGTQLWISSRGFQFPREAY